MKRQGSLPLELFYLRQHVCQCLIEHTNTEGRTERKTERKTDRQTTSQLDIGRQRMSSTDIEKAERTTAARQRKTGRHNYTYDA